MLERPLRPQYLHEYIGQDSVILKRLNFDGADHVLLFSPPGLSRADPANLGVNLGQTSGPVIEKVGDLVAILTT